MSDLLQISASIIQGSAIGPASYDVTASDLAAASPGNILCKYADDTYVNIPAQNVDTRTAELLNIEAWSRDNNLTLTLRMPSHAPHVPSVETTKPDRRCTT